MPTLKDEVQLHQYVGIITSTLLRHMSIPQDRLCGVPIEIPIDEAAEAKVFKVSKAVPRKLNQFQLIINALYRTTACAIGEVGGVPSCLIQVPQMAEILNAVSRVSGDVLGSQGSDLFKPTTNRVDTVVKPLLICD
jgi:hypothetical protein